MPKGYWIARVNVTNPDQYRLYAEAAPEVFKTFGGRYLARGGKFQQMEGDERARNVVIEFPSLQAAIDCYNSPGYQAAKAKRKGAGIADIVLVEGV